MTYKELKQAVERSNSTTYAADAFRKAFGVERVEQKPKRKQQHKRGNYKKYARLMNNRYGCGDRFGK